MPSTNIATRPDPAADPDQLATTRWETPPAVAPPDAGGATVALPDLSTPSPNAPDRLTNLEVTDGMAEPPGAPGASAPASRLPPIPGYQVEKYVGSGGMGVVYRAKHHATGRTVALKLTSPRGAQDDVVRDRFRGEVHALAAIKHPNIVPMYDAGEWHGFLYCTMEFVAGGTLNDHLGRIRSDTRGAVRLIVKVARAVEHLHAERIIHRDLKPLNILIGPGDEPLVADFGLAKWIDKESDLTLTGLPVGTRQYMSPEQTLGRKQNYTAACDVWAMGVTLYELLTGQRPFSDDGATDVYHSIRTTAPPTMAALSADVPEPLQAVALKCLAKKPADRYASAAALADDLDRWLRGDPILAEPAAAPPPVEEPARTEPNRVRTTKGVYAAMAASMLALAAVVIGLFGPGRAPTAAPAAEPALVGPVLPPKKVPEGPAAERPPRSPDGRTVYLTDKMGRPLTDPLDEPQHALHPDKIGDYYAFTGVGAGITELPHTALPVPYRVKADVAIKYNPQQRCSGGIYVGRRPWAGLPSKHESLLLFGLQPGYVPKTPVPQLNCLADLYWWERNENGATQTLRVAASPWSPDGKTDQVRFAEVLIDVRAESVTGTVDGHAFAPITDQQVVKDLQLTVSQRRAVPGYQFSPPAVGPGIGVFCLNSTCAVRNLTVSKLDR